MWNTAPPPTYPLLTRQLEVPVRAAEFLQWLLPILPVLPKPIVPGWGTVHSRLNWRMVMARSSAKTVRSLEPQQAGPGEIGRASCRERGRATAGGGAQDQQAR